MVAQQTAPSEERLTRLEAKMGEHSREIGGMRQDIRDLRSSIDTLRNIVIVAAIGAVVTLIIGAFI